MAEFYITSIEADTLISGADKVKASLGEGEPGIVSQTPKEEDIEKLKTQLKQEDAKKEPAQVKVGYLGANYRDIQYCVTGRKYLRILGAQGKYYAYSNRFDVANGL